MNADECRETIAILSKEFKIRRPMFNVGRGEVGHYLHSKKLITIGMRDGYFSVENTVLHEFAHHLEYCRNGGRLAEKNSAHGYTFVRALTDVVLAWYGDLDSYCWDREYKQVQRIYRDRYLDKAA